MRNVMLFSESNPDIGLLTRSSISGVENALVMEFVDHFCYKFIRHNKKTDLAVFIEPRIDSGYPDIVFVSYLQSIVDNWTDKRIKLSRKDLKLLSYLNGAKIASDVKIITKLGLSKSQAISSLERLMDAKLIAYNNHVWNICPLHEIFSLTKIVAVEAKLNNVGKVFEQTHLNTWFASHSYALTNSTRPQNGTLKTFSQFGLGLYCKGSQFRKVVEAKRNALPSSYISFQFNEWVGRAITHRGGHKNA